MDMKAIRALAEIMKANDLTQVEITEEGKTIRMKREIAAVPVPAQTPFAPVMPAPGCCTGIRSFPRDTAAGRGH